MRNRYPIIIRDSLRTETRCLILFFFHPAGVLPSQSLLKTLLLSAILVLGDVIDLIVDLIVQIFDTFFDKVRLSSRPLSVPLGGF